MSNKKRTSIASTPEERENILISLAYDAAEERIRSGKASSQEIIHFLKMGSSRNELEMEKLNNENEVLRAKADAIGSQQEIKEMYSEAMKAFKVYSGQEEEDEY